MTPDGEMWDTRKTSRGTLYIAPNAPEGSGDLLLEPSEQTGPLIGRGEYGAVYRASANLVIKQSLRTVKRPAPAVERFAFGLDGLRFAVSLERGLKLLGDDAILPPTATSPDGPRLVMTDYHGALIGPWGARIAMSPMPEGARPIFDEDGSASTHNARMVVVRAALGAVGFKNTHFFSSVDDLPTDRETNLFALPDDGSGQSQVMLLDPMPMR